MCLFSFIFLWRALKVECSESNRKIADTKTEFDMNDEIAIQGHSGSFICNQLQTGNGLLIAK